MTVRVLVAGAASGVAQAVVKALRISCLDVTVIAADIDPFNPLMYRADGALLFPRVETPGALETVLDIIRNVRADVVVSGSVFDLPFLAEHKQLIEHETGALVIVSPPETIAIGLDKWATTEFLRTNDLPHAEAYLATSADEAVAVAERWGFPVMLKDRFGRASRGVHVIRSSAEMVSLWPAVPNAMLQKLIAEPRASLDCEYTCSILRLKNGLRGPFTARRALRGGHSWTVEVDRFENIDPLLRAIGEKLPIFGSLNVQLMVGPEGPVPFEFNPRFSGTTAMRAHFGFNEPAMLIRSYLLGEDVPEPEQRKGLAFRYLDEVFVDGASAADIGPGAHAVRHDWF